MCVDVPSLEEEYGWMYDEDDDPPVVTESDVSDADEIAEADYDWMAGDHDPPRRENKWNPLTWSN